MMFRAIFYVNNVQQVEVFDLNDTPANNFSDAEVKSRMNEKKAFYSAIELKKARIVLKHYNNAQRISFSNSNQSSSSGNEGWGMIILIVIVGIILCMLLPIFLIFGMNDKGFLKKPFKGRKLNGYSGFKIAFSVIGVIMTIAFIVLVIVGIACKNQLLLKIGAIGIFAGNTSLTLLACLIGSKFVDKTEPATKSVDSKTQVSQNNQSFTKNIDYNLRNKCPFCHALIDDKMTTCPSCKKSLTIVKERGRCRKCGAMLSPEKEYCTNCGQMKNSSDNYFVNRKKTNQTSANNTKRTNTTNRATSKNTANGTSSYMEKMRQEAMRKQNIEISNKNTNSNGSSGGSNGHFRKK